MRSLALTLALTTAALLHAQTPPPHFEISTPNHQTTFHIGERIPLTLSFTGPADTYEAILYNFGRAGGNENFDTFEVSPATGWADSLGVYYAVTPMGCCGAKQAGMLSATPTTLDVNLNEWARFDEPGTYTLTITSHRIHLFKEHTSFFSGHNLDVRSNALTIHIIADTPDWQRNTLKRAIRIIEQQPPRDPNNYDAPPPAFSIASEDLRYLASPDAMPVLAASLRDQYGPAESDAYLGLIGLPRSVHDAALNALDRLIDDPTFPITEHFLEVITWLQLDEPAPPEITDDLDASRAAYENFALAHKHRADPFIASAWESVARALPHKVEPARSITAQTLVENRPGKPSAFASAQIGAILRASFPRLTELQKYTLLKESWDLLNDRSMLPQLRTLAVQESPEDYVDGFGRGSLSAIAIRRWYEFEPEAATAEIVDRIGSAKPTLSVADIAYLPPQTFPQFEMLWANAFATTELYSEKNTLGALLVQFGTGIAVPRIAALLTEQGNSSDGNLAIPAMAYLVRFAPATAKRMIEQSDAKPPVKENQNDFVDLLSIARLAQDPLFAEIALARLNNSRPNVVADGAQYLARYGDDTARQPILDRYVAWSKEWSTKPAKEGEEEVRDEDRELGSTLARTLLAAQGWLADSALIATVQDHCTGRDLCDEITRLAKPNLQVLIWSDGQYSVGNVDMIPTLELFEAKLDQYPKGTEFLVDHVTTGETEAQRKLEATLPDLLLKHGMKLASQ